MNLRQALDKKSSPLELVQMPVFVIEKGKKGKGIFPGSLSQNIRVNTPFFSSW